AVDQEIAPPARGQGRQGRAIEVDGHFVAAIADDVFVVAISEQWQYIAISRIISGEIAPALAGGDIVVIEPFGAVWSAFSIPAGEAMVAEGGVGHRNIGQ